MRRSSSLATRLAAVLVVMLLASACIDLGPVAIDEVPAPDGPGSDDAPKTPALPAPPKAGTAVSDVAAPKAYGFSCSDSKSEVAASGAPSVSAGDATIFIGMQQVSSNNQDPRVVRFDGAKQTWCRDDIETGDDDGRGYGLLWSGDTLYGVFSATGTQGAASGDYRRYTTKGWLKTYSDASPRGGGGPKASVILRFDPADGTADAGSFLTALTSEGKTNSLAVTSLALDGDQLTVGANSYFRPRRADRSAMDCTGDSPFAATYDFDAALTTVTRATAVGCS